MRVRAAAMLGFLGVALGAAGAHGSMHDLVVERGTLKNWETAVDYHLIHAVVLLILAALGPTLTKWAVAAWRLVFFGVLIFSGSLYVLSMSGIKWLGAITPLGGLCLMIGWLLIALGCGRGSKAAT